MAQISLKECTLYIVDGTGTPNEIAVSLGDGNITWDISKTIEYTLERGSLTNSMAIEGDDVPLSLSFDARFDYWKNESGDNVSPADALLQTGGASAWASVDSDACAPYAVDIYVIRDLGTCFTTGGGTNRYEKFIFSTFRAESVSADLDAGTLSFSGTCQVTTPTVVRSTSASRSAS